MNQSDVVLWANSGSPFDLIRDCATAAIPQEKPLVVLHSKLNDKLASSFYLAHTDAVFAWPQDGLLLDGVTKNLLQNRFRAKT